MWRVVGGGSMQAITETAHNSDGDYAYDLINPSPPLFENVSSLICGQVNHPRDQDGEMISIASQSLVAADCLTV